MALSSPLSHNSTFSFSGLIFVNSVLEHLVPSNFQSALTCQVLDPARSGWCPQQHLVEFVCSSGTCVDPRSVLWLLPQDKLATAVSVMMRPCDNKPLPPVTCDSTSHERPFHGTCRTSCHIQTGRPLTFVVICHFAYCILWIDNKMFLFFLCSSGLLSFYKTFLVNSYLVKFYLWLNIQTLVAWKRFWIMIFFEGVGGEKVRGR